MLPSGSLRQLLAIRGKEVERGTKQVGEIASPPLRRTLKGWRLMGDCDEGENTTKIRLCQVPAQIAVSRFAIGMTHLTVGMAKDSPGTFSDMRPMSLC